MTIPPTDVLIVGAGPAGLIAAERLAVRGLGVTVIDRMPSPARKFLLAGRGGLNLTHAEPRDAFLARYGDAAGFLAPMLDAFPPSALRQWAAGLGQATFVGSSRRVFPESFKTSPLLRAWLGRLDGLGVRLLPTRRLVAIDAPGRLRFEGPEGAETREAAAVLLALGGASWPRMGSDGAWSALLAPFRVPIVPFSAANSGLRVPWSPGFAERAHGEVLKRIALDVGGERWRGEAVVTRTGLEGGAVYSAGRALRRALAKVSPVTVHVDLRPDMDEANVVARLAVGRAGDSLSVRLRKRLALPPVAIGLMREAVHDLPREAAPLARLVKAVPVPVEALAGLDRAISSAGGIALDAVDADLMLKALPGAFVVGEMLDWDAPTGGYLLQACFSTGMRAADAIGDRLAARAAPPAWTGGW